jgi:NAD(P)H-hydrate epimerase
MQIKKLLPKRPADCHKGDFGRLGLIAGSKEMLGAAILTALSALRAGAGLVYLMTIDSVSNQINITYPEIIVLPLPSQDGYITEEALPIIEIYIGRFLLNALAIGPGLGQNPKTQKLVQKLIFSTCLRSKIPTCLDADGLNAIAAKMANWQSIQPEQFVLTPHPKEFERLFRVLPQTAAERKTLCQKAAKNLGQTIVLKGHCTVVASPQNHIVNTTGNPGLATPGTGDVLTGIISAFMAQGLNSFDAAVLGTYLHGLSADLAIKKYSEIGLIATDVIDHLGPAILEVQKNK